MTYGIEGTSMTYGIDSIRYPLCSRHPISKNRCIQIILKQLKNKRGRFSAGFSIVI